jgi:hypothetical protein
LIHINNDSLVSITGFPVLSTTGGISFFANDELSYITGFPNLLTLNGSLSFTENYLLYNISGFSNLTSIAGDLNIRETYGLSDLSVFTNLTHVGEDIEITGNGSLNSLSGLDNLEAESIVNLSIYNNWLLWECEVQSICDYLASPNGVVQIYSNYTGCNSIEQVESACETFTSCLPEGITFTTQEEIDNFQTNYPGCTEIEGGVTISGNDINNLSGLSVLTSIAGGLEIVNNYTLTSLNGLEGITALHYLLIANNPDLTDLSGFDNLSSTEVALGIWMNASLTSLNGLENLTSIGGFMEVAMNNTLTNLDGIGNIISIGGYLYIYFNTSLISISGLENIDAASIDSLSVMFNPLLSVCNVESICNYLAAPNGTIEIHDNAPGCNSLEEVEEACGFHCLPEGITFTSQEQIDNFQANYPGCTEIEGGVTITGNGILSLNGLNLLNEIGDSLFVINTHLQNFTGLNSINFIGGGITILDNSYLSSLNGFESLLTVNDGISLWNNDILSSMDGFNSLTFIGGDISISNNNSLIDLSGLENLTFVDGDFYISYNENLESLTAFNNLNIISGSLSFHSNDNLNSLVGLENLNTIGGDFVVFGSSFNNLSGLDNLQSIGDFLHISTNSSLTSLDGLNSLISIGGGILIGGNDVLVDLSSLINIHTLGSSLGSNLIVQGNSNLENLEGLNNLTTLGGFVNISNTNLTALNGLESLNSIGTHLEINSNPMLTNLNGLYNLNSINGHLYIEYNDVLSSLTGLDNIDPNSIENVRIHDNPILSECDVQSLCELLSIPNPINWVYNNAPGCNSVVEVLSECGACLPEGITFTTQDEIDNFQSNYPDCMEIQGNVIINGESITNLNGLSFVTTIVGYLYIHDNNDLTSLQGLDNLTSVGGLLLFDNNNLTTLTGLDNLTANTGSLLIGSNTNLINLTGLESLTSSSSIRIGDLFATQGNPNLISLSGIENIEESSFDELVISGNGSLSDCDVQSICEYLASPNGTTYIFSNATGCNDQAEVEAACLTAEEEIRSGMEITITPNPSKDKITISSPALKGNTQLSIFNVSGEKVIERQLTDNETQIDISTLSRGVYFVRVQNEMMVEVGKMIKE